ncbi:S66 peptidase family protein [Jeotgalibacillus proteolyticus]|uniref:LD-carboxypeptidase n=1 Tax=Jeotgalibacillus proteolyticus TaxID=2082395 RepID=A0A2S5GA06_9BACL|nr:LD-carboxypeptidase [Jeotgalibacillus proteolyticus]PPA69826.1 LD-carboxypeptidase [Jeotgalibacillus proteolyticus]
MILPKKLKRGDTVGIIAPASPPNQENLEKSFSFLKELGLNVKIGSHVKEVYGYLAGTDENRLRDLHTMFSDPSVDAIICAGGGYGTARIAAHIDYSLIKNNPKIFWGYSDITFLHTAIRQETELVTFHGPMLASDVGKEEFQDLSKKMFLQLFEPKELHYSEQISPLEVISEGERTGDLVGGNLSLIQSSIGTPYELDTEGKLLFIEDIDEPPYRVDGMLNQLLMAGKLQAAAGIVVGDFKNAVPTNNKPSLSLDEVLEHYLGGLQTPVLKGFKIGHCEPHFSIPLGVKARLSSKTKSLTIMPGVQ